MDRRAVLSLALAAACRSDARPPEREAAAPPAIAIAIDAAPAPDAEVFALFDRLAIRSVTWPKAPRRVELPGGAPRTLALAVTSEGQPVTEHDPRVPGLHVPPWMQQHVGDAAVEDVELEPDGSSLVRAGRMLVLVDRDHHSEIGLDFGAPPEAVLMREGDPPRATVVGDFSLVGARRVGQLVILGTEIDRHDALVGVDATTGEVVWRTRPDVDRRFVIAGDHAIASATLHGRPVLVAVALDTGAIDASVPTAHGPYRLWQRVPGEIRGTWARPTERFNVTARPTLELIATATPDR